MSKRKSRGKKKVKSEKNRSIGDILKKYEKFLYPFSLILIIILGFWVRTRNVGSLAGKYLLGVDPYVIYRYTEYILDHGSLIAHDSLRYYPVGTSTDNLKLLSYILAYSYKLIHSFIPSLTQMEWHIYYPPTIAAFSFIIFFLFVKELFDKRVALVSTLFLAILPAYNFRTMAGFADKESMAMLFMFISLYFWVRAWKSEKIIFALISGVFGGLMASTWWGVRFLTVLIALFILASILFTKVKQKHFWVYCGWLFPFLLLSATLPTKYGSISFYFIKNIDIGLLIFSLFTFLIYMILPTIIHRLNIKMDKSDLPILAAFLGILHRLNIKYDKSDLPLLAISLGILLIIVPVALLGIIDIGEIIYRLSFPGGTLKGLVYVAENVPPTFIDIWSGFGFSLVLILAGSTFLFYKLVENSRFNDILTVSYILFFIAVINGSVTPTETNFFNKTYFFWLFGFISVVGIVYLYSHFNRNLEEFNPKWQLIFVWLWFFFSFIMARTMMRLIFVFTPAVSLVIGYFVVEFNQFLKSKRCFLKTREYILTVLIVVVSIAIIWNIASSFVYNTGIEPIFSEDWDNATSWIRENTSPDDVFLSWWDYGYFIQTMGERATVLDPGNKRVDWSHLVSRYFFFNSNETTTLEFLRTHDVSYILIHPEDLRITRVVSEIGSEDDDIKTNLGIFYEADEKNGVYSGVWWVDQDLELGDLFVEMGEARVEEISMEDNTPIATLTHENQQYKFPISCVCELTECMNYNITQPHLKGCVILHESGLFYVPEKMKDTNLAKLYLFDLKSEFFNEVYRCGDSQFELIRIWEVKYPSE